MAYSFTFSQKDKTVPLKVISTSFILSRSVKQFYVTKFSPLSLHKISRDYNTREKIKSPNNPLFENGNAADATVDPKINPFSEIEDDPKNDYSKSLITEDNLQRKPSKDKISDQIVSLHQGLDSFFETPSSDKFESTRNQ